MCTCSASDHATRLGSQIETMFPIKNTIPSRHPAVVTWLLIAVNFTCFLYENSLTQTQLDSFLSSYALVTARYPEQPFAPAAYLPFFTMMFLHAGWLHLIGNMWTLWLFGPTIEDRIGHAWFLAFYLACGFAAAIAQVASDLSSTVPALGASGAIAGVMGCFVFWFPWARIIVVVLIIFLPLFFELPAIVFIGIWFAVQLLNGTVQLLGPEVGGGVAWWAHVGGFVFGLAVAALLTRPRPAYRPYYADEGILGFNPHGYR